jgi:hypothetical protein
VASKEVHLEQARVNRKLAEELLARGRETGDQACIDWSVTVAFYSALHIIEAHLAVHGFQPRHHWQRSTMLAAINADADMVLAYEILHDMSEQTRYHARHYDALVVERIVFGNYLPRVERPPI